MSSRTFLEQSQSQPENWSRLSRRILSRPLVAAALAILLAALAPVVFAQQAPQTDPGYNPYPPASPQDTPPPPPDAYAPQQQPYAQQSPQQQYAPQYSQPPQPYSGQPQYQQQPYSDQQPYPQQTQPALTEDQLEQLFAPIALYPDSLVAQILAASTYPTQIAEADRWRRSMGYASPDAIAAQANAQPWDPGVKALTAFPQVLAQLDQNLNWTTELGNAWFNQPQDVTNAIQALRQRAQASGNLESTPQETVTDNQGYVDIAPANPQIVYVPGYDPWLAYGAPLAPWPGFYFGGLWGPWYGIRYGLGCVLTAFSHMPWGWFGWGFDWFGHGLLYQHQFWYSHSRSLVDWGLPHGGPRAWGRGNMMAGRGGYGRPGYGGRSVYGSRANDRYTPRSFNPGNPAEGWRRDPAATGPRAAQAFNRSPAFNARPGYNLPSRNFAPPRSFGSGYDSRTLQSYNRGQAMNSFRPSAPRSMPSYRAYGGIESFSRGGFDQRSARPFNGPSGHAEHFSGGGHFNGGNRGGGGHFSGGHPSGGHSSHSGGGHRH